MIFTLSLDGRLTSLNPAGQRVLGYTGPEVQQLKIDEILAPGSQNLSGKLLEMNAAGGNASTYDCQLVSKSGQRLEIEISLRLVLKDGKPDSIQAIGRDITQRKRAEEELFNSRQMLRLVLDTIPQRVFWKDRNLVFVGCNKALVQDSGYKDSNEILGKTDFEMSWAAMRGGVSRRRHPRHGVGPVQAELRGTPDQVGRHPNLVEDEQGPVA